MRTSPAKTALRDQFVAFKNPGRRTRPSAEEIAARFGYSDQTVRRRLRLGAVSPRLVAACVNGKLTLEAAQKHARSMRDKRVRYRIPPTAEWQEAREHRHCGQA